MDLNSSRDCADAEGAPTEEVILAEAIVPIRKKKAKAQRSSAGRLIFDN